MDLFTQDAPAESIHTLILYLQSEHQHGDLYRGQLQDYPTLVPSMFRSGIVSGTEHQNIVGIDEDRIYKYYSPRRNKLRKLLHEYLISECGIIVGNILAQQYGVTSECIDVTSDIKVAGYFATRIWPSYSHNSNPGTGVIYRFKRGNNRNSSLHNNNSTLSLWLQLGHWGALDVCPRHLS